MLEIFISSSIFIYNAYMVNLMYFAEAALHFIMRSS